MSCGSEEFKRIKDDPVNATASDLKVAINCLQSDVKDLNREIKNLSTTTSDFNTKIGQSKNILGDMKKSVTDLVISMKNFVKSTQEQYKLTEQLAKSYKATAISIGLSVDKSRELAKEFKGAVANISEFGGTIEDVQNIYTNFAENSGRVRILGENEVTNIFKLEKAAGLFGNEAESLYETLDLMGVSNEDATARMVELIKDSQSVALNSSKVIKTLTSNFKTLQTYSFANGVKGMTEMAKLAVKMRLDVSEMLGMTEKFYEPEAAIEAAANLQMLGGDIAKAFGDPFQLMYEARNKPEELAKRLQSMTENMIQFNDVTKEYDFPPEVRMQLKSVGDQLGINIDSMVEVARQTAKMKDVKMKLDMKGNITDDDMKEGIANLARMEGGQFKVDFRDQNGDKITKSIEELTSGDAELLLKAPKDEKDYMDKMLYEAQTTNERLKNIDESFKFGYVKDIDPYQFMENATKQTIESIRESATGILKGAKELGGELLGDRIKQLNEGVKGFDTLLSHTIGQFKDFNLKEVFFEKIDDTDPDVNVNTNGVVNVTGKNQTQGTVSPNVTVPPSKDYMVRSNGTKVNFNSKDDVIGAMKGGPLDNLIKESISNRNNQGGVPSKIEFGDLNISGKIEIVSPNGTNVNIDMNTIKPLIEKTIISHLNGKFRNGGVPSSKEMSDYMK